MESNETPESREEQIKSSAEALAYHIFGFLQQARNLHASAQSLDASIRMVEQTYGPLPLALPSLATPAKKPKERRVRPALRPSGASGVGGADDGRHAPMVALLENLEKELHGIPTENPLISQINPQANPIIRSDPSGSTPAQVRNQPSARIDVTPVTEPCTKEDQANNDHSGSENEDRGSNEAEGVHGGSHTNLPADAQQGHTAVEHTQLSADNSNPESQQPPPPPPPSQDHSDDDPQPRKRTKTTSSIPRFTAD